MTKDKKCRCQNQRPGLKGNEPKFKGEYAMVFIIGLILWFLIYIYLHEIAQVITFKLLHVRRGTRLGESLEFFFYDTPKVLMLLSLVIFFSGIIRSFITPAKIRHILTGKGEFLGNILAAILGIVTPFCSCSAIPLFVGFVTAGIPLGITFSFLISAPMVNEIALVLLYGLLGWKVAAIYLSTGLIIAISAGFIIGRLHMENYIEDWVTKLDKNAAINSKVNSITWNNRFIMAVQSIKDIVAQIWIFIIIGIGVGATIHGYVPNSLMASIMGRSAWWSVPIAIMIGIPMYSNPAGIIPVVEALLSKGAALGTVLAFMMSVITLSLPEMFILRKILKMRLIYVFIAVVTLGILIVGYLFNWLIFNVSN